MYCEEATRILAKKSYAWHMGRDSGEGGKMKAKWNEVGEEPHVRPRYEGSNILRSASLDDGHLRPPVP